METLLQAVIIIFMLFLCALCLFAVLVIARDIIAESGARRRREEERRNIQAKEVEPLKCEPVAVAAPEAHVFELPAKEEEPTSEPEEEAKEEPVTEPEPIEEEPVAEAEEDGNSVTFSKSHNMTMKSRYAALSSEFKGYFDQVVRHAMSKDGVKVNETTSYYDYKIGAKRVMRISIKRGEIVCEFTFIDRDFNTYARANNIKVKPSATSIRVTEASAVGVAKDGIDVVCAQIAEEKEYKKELARERRRERRRQKANDAENSEESVENVPAEETVSEASSPAEEVANV